MAEQDKRSPKEKPVLLSKDIESKLALLDREINYLLNKAKFAKPKKAKNTTSSEKSSKANSTVEEKDPPSRENHVDSDPPPTEDHKDPDLPPTEDHVDSDSGESPAEHE